MPPHIRLVGHSPYSSYRGGSHPPPIVAKSDEQAPIDGGMVAVAYGAVLLIGAVVIAFVAFAILRFGGWW
jgi:hypothetical protein